MMSSFPRCAELIEMKPGKIAHAIAVLLSSISSLFAHATDSKAEPAKVKFSKKSNKLSEDLSLKVDPISFSPGRVSAAPPDPGERFPWKNSIVTTVFWIGERSEERRVGKRVE